MSCHSISIQQFACAVKLGYFEHAAYLAKRWSRHEDYLRIQIEDTGNFNDALSYLRQLGPEAVSRHLFRMRPLIVLFSRRKIIWHDTGRAMVAGFT